MRAARAALLSLSIACTAAIVAPAATLAWKSTATGRDVSVELLASTRADSAPAPLVVYLKNLAAPRLGTESDEAIVADFRRDGYQVAVFDYGKNSRARWPWINRDFAELRAAIHRRAFLAGVKLDPAHIFIVPAGYRLRRDVPFARDGARVLAMDILYPAKPARPVGTVLEFSCDNADRMGNFSLQFCTDTLLEGAATEGFAAAMADHPVPAPYKGFDAMPECAQRIKAAVRTLRAAAGELPLDGRIVPVGFSRGSGMALMLATTQGRAEFDSLGEHRGISSDVQGAVVLSGRFTYLDLLPQDPMIPRYVAAWSERAAHLETWRAHGALDYLAVPTVPLFLSINATESPEALHQMEVLRTRLGALGSPFEFHPENEPRGHRVPLAPEVLDPLLIYLRARLGVAATGPAPSSPPVRSPPP